MAAAPASFQMSLLGYVGVWDRLRVIQVKSSLAKSKVANRDSY